MEWQKTPFLSWMNIGGVLRKKDLYLKNHITVQGYTYIKDTSKIVDEVAVAAESGFDSKYFTIYSDKNGFFNFHYIMTHCYLWMGQRKN